MFKLPKRGKKQAKRNVKKQPTVKFQWRKSWNWGFLLIPLSLGVYQLAQMEQIMPIRSIQLVGSFEYLDQRWHTSLAALQHFVRSNAAARSMRSASSRMVEAA